MGKQNGESMTVNSGQLRKISDEIRHNATSYNNYIEEIYRQLKVTLNQHWKGPDYDEFIKNMNAKRNNTDSITKSLNELASYLDDKAEGADRI